MIDDVAVLYVDPRGPYPSRVVHWFDAERDATTYAMDLPVVAHPPCGPWGRLKHLSKHDLKEHALHAVEVVRRVGGVLEHPRDSGLWAAAWLPAPGELPDAWGGVSVRVDQCDWGHVARKATWLYVVGTRELGAVPAKREPTHWISGGRAREGSKRLTTPVPAGIKVCSAQQRRRTPPAFADWLIALAQRCRQ